MRKTILYIACSLDSYIAAPGDNLEFLSVVEEEGQDYGYYDFIRSIDTVIMGRKTYDWVMSQVKEYPHKDLYHNAYCSSAKGKPGILQRQAEGSHPSFKGFSW